MSSTKLPGGRRKRRAARDIKSPYDCHSLRRKLVRTLPVPFAAQDAIFDPYRKVSDEVAQKYQDFMESTTGDDKIELFHITVNKAHFITMEYSQTWLENDVSLIFYYVTFLVKFMVLLCMHFFKVYYFIMLIYFLGYYKVMLVLFIYVYYYSI